ncbi:MAG TPA: S8 family serine peptidase [Pseudolabrys sp.]|nr:S8 family serine peptidase [Pseudolabrys sp.]
MDPVAEISGIQALQDSVSGGDPSIRIAIIDGPVDLTHPSLSGARVTADGASRDLVSPVRSEHGTHVASVIVGQSGSPVTGIAPNCTAVVYSIYRESADGELEPSSQATLALAINQAVADGADIINISSGQLTPTGQAQHILTDAARGAAQAGALIVAAAGNDGCRCLQVPAALDSVLAVGACDATGRPLDFSNFGDAYAENGILAPGDNIKGASPQSQVALRSGTSFATPIVSGVAALLLSRLKQAGRDADPFSVRDALLQSVIACAADADSEARCLAGTLNVPGAVAALFADEANAPRASPSEARAPPAMNGALRPAHASNSPVVTPSSVTRESTMPNASNIAPSAPRILGPDGNAISSAAITPSGLPATPALQVEPAAAPPIAPTATSVVPAAVVPSEAPPVAAPAPIAPPAISQLSGMRPSAADCGCGGLRPAQASAIQMAFPIGRLYYDFGSEARLDYFVQAMASWRDGLGTRGGDIGKDFGPDRDKSGDAAAPYNPEYMVRYLMNLAPGEQQKPADQDSNLRDADAVHRTLTIDAVPIYRIRPLDVFGLGFFASLILALFYQEVSPFPPTDPRSFKDAAASPPAPDGELDYSGVTRVSFAGWLDGSTTRLLNGTVVPTLTTDWRGFYQWSLEQLLGPKPWPAGVGQFLDRIYNEFRNVGISPQNRALNYSAMNAHNTKKIFAAMANQNKRLDTVEVDRSAICRPESDCWDVTYRFFDPTAVLTQARQVFQYTIDVSDLVPVTVGPLRQWQIY